VTAEDAPKAGWREWPGPAVLALTTLLACMDLFVMPRHPTRHNPDSRGPCRALPLGGTRAAPFGSVRGEAS
jgi:hypothetical protein